LSVAPESTEAPKETPRGWESKAHPQNPKNPKPQNPRDQLIKLILNKEHGGCNADKNLDV